MSTIGKFIVNEARVESMMYPYAVELTLRSTGPIDLNALRDVVGVTIELRHTPKGVSAYGRVQGHT